MQYLQINDYQHHNIIIKNQVFMLSLHFDKLKFESHEFQKFTVFWVSYVLLTQIFWVRYCNLYCIVTKSVILDLKPVILGTWS